MKNRTINDTYHFLKVVKGPTLGVMLLLSGTSQAVETSQPSIAAGGDGSGGGEIIELKTQEVGAAILRRLGEVGACLQELHVTPELFSRSITLTLRTPGLIRVQNVDIPNCENRGPRMACAHPARGTLPAQIRWNSSRFPSESADQNVMTIHELLRAAGFGTAEDYGSGATHYAASRCFAAALNTPFIPLLALEAEFHAGDPVVVIDTSISTRDRGGLRGVVPTNRNIHVDATIVRINPNGTALINYDNRSWSGLTISLRYLRRRITSFAGFSVGESVVYRNSHGSHHNATIEKVFADGTADLRIDELGSFKAISLSTICHRTTAFGGFHVGDRVEVTQFDGVVSNATVTAVYSDGTASVQYEETGRNNWWFSMDVSLRYLAHRTP